MGAWEEMAAPILRRTDPRLMDKVRAEFRERAYRLDGEVLVSGSVPEVMAEVYAGWEVYAFPDYPDAVTVRTAVGWAYVPTFVSADPEEWAGRAPGHRAEIVAAGRRLMFGFESLGEYVSAILGAPTAGRLHSGVWEPMRGRCEDAEVNTMRFLYELGDVVDVPDGLFTVGGLVGAGL